MQILKDVLFKKGFNIRATTHVENEDINPDYILKLNNDKPEWFISQWFSKDSLKNGIEIKNNKVRLQDSTKCLRTDDNGIYLELNGSKEYSTIRKIDEPWAHLLLEQIFNGEKLINHDKLEMVIDFDFIKWIDHMKESIDKNIHTAQFQWFLNFANFNKESKGYKDFFWFGISFMDIPRYDFTPEYMAMDGGKDDSSLKFIYIIDSKEFLNKKINLNDNIKIKLDVIKYIKYGFEQAKSRGFLKDTNYEDLGFNSTNIGFEVTGTFDIGVKINKIGLLG